MKVENSTQEDECNQSKGDNSISDFNITHTENIKRRKRQNIQIMRKF